MNRLGTPLGEPVEQRAVERAERDPTTPFTARYTEEVAADVREVQAERSKRAIKQDRRRNATIPANFDTWKDSPDRYDWPRVDTVPRVHLENRIDTVEQAMEQAQKAQFQTTPLQGPLLGETEISDDSDRPAEVRIDADEHPSSPRILSKTEATTRAHESAHVIGETGETPQREQIFNNQTALMEADALSERVRGASPPVSNRSDAEVFGEAGAAALLSPNMARREAPTFTEEFETALEAEVGISLDDVF